MQPELQGAEPPTKPLYPTEFCKTQESSAGISNPIEPAHSTRTPRPSGSATVTTTQHDGPWDPSDGWPSVRLRSRQSVILVLLYDFS